MRLLNRFFTSPESLAKDAKKDEEALYQHWRDYLATISEKKKIIEQLPYAFGNKNNVLKRLKELLDLELVDVHTVEKNEDEIIQDIHSLEHNKKIKRVKKLEYCIGYAETKYKHVYELLRHLYSILRSEADLLKKLMNAKELRKYRTLVSALQSAFLAEEEVLRQIGNMRTFQTLFPHLITGEHIIRTMDAKEKKLLKKMQEILDKIFSGKIKEGAIHYLTKTIFDAVEDSTRSHEAIEDLNRDFNLDLEPHQDVHFEFVNRPEFINFVREAFRQIRKQDLPEEIKKETSEQMINVFVHIFREWYNHERE